MSVEYRRAGLDDLDRLVCTRVEVLRAANELEAGADMRAVEAESRRYYREALASGRHTAYLALDRGEVVGTGGISYYRVMPTWHNPSGEKAYIMNMYTRPDHRRTGVATGMLERLVADARARGVTAIGLEATRMGRPLYLKYGFVPAGSEMELPEAPDPKAAPGDSGEE